MKSVKYNKFILSIIIPCTTGIVILKVIRWLNGLKILSKILNFIAFLGCNTIPIMFLHMPLNNFFKSILHLVDLCIN